MDKWRSELENYPSLQDYASEEFPWAADLKKIMHERFGLRAFRKNQKEVINATLCSKDVFVLMPTGGGKSLCYQLPGIISSGVSVIISPLISLMKDQVCSIMCFPLA
jgi:superfamily II DNA helicase RecQ